MEINDIEVIAQNNLEKALQVIEKSGVRQAWESIGATVNQVGSMAMGLLMKHRDIDFHIYTDKLDIAESFKAVQKICAAPAVTRWSTAILLIRKKPVWNFISGLCTITKSGR